MSEWLEHVKAILFNQTTVNKLCHLHMYFVEVEPLWPPKT